MQRWTNSAPHRVNHSSTNARLACFPWFYVGQRRDIEGQQDACVKAYQRCVELADDNNRHSVSAIAQWRLNKLNATVDNGTK